MPTLDDVRTAVASLPGVEERMTSAGVSWSVRRKPFAWECRPWPSIPAEVRAIIAAEPVLGVKVAEPDDARALREMAPGVFLPQTTRWSEPKIALRLRDIDLDHLTELVIDGWRSQAPRYLVRLLDGV